MKKYIFMMSILTTLGFSSLVSNVNALNMEYGVGATWFTNTHTIDSNVHSILKWRDMDAVSANAYIKSTPINKLYIKLSGEYGWIYGGEMTDDDIQNTVSYKSGDVAAAIFSVTKKLKGYDYNIVLTSGYELFNAKNNKINAVLGYKHGQVKMEPKGIYQVRLMYLVDEPIKQVGMWAQSDEKTQHANLTFSGFLVGAEYVKEFEEKNSFFVELLAFLPIHTETVISHWSPQSADGSKEGSFTQRKFAVGLDAKAGTNINITSHYNITLYSFFNYLHISNQLEKRIPQADGTPRANLIGKYSSYSKIGVGLNFYYK